MLDGPPASGGETIEPARPAPWGYFLTFVWTVLAFLVSTGAAIVCCFWWFGSDPLRSFQTPYDGVLVSVSTIASIPVQIAMLALAIRLRRWPVAEYLGLVMPRRRDIIRSVALLIVIVGVVEGVLFLLGKDVVTSFQVDSYRTAKAAGWLPGLFAAIVLVAPAGEEIMFRGFLYRGFVRRPGHEPYAIVIITLAWVMLHVQYDWDGLLQVFIIGLLLGWVRWSTGSTALTILMHMLMNLWATIETAVKMEGLLP